MRNRVKCRLCKEVIESRHRHEFVRCHCEAIAIDGGEEYPRQIGLPENFIHIDEEGKEVDEKDSNEKGIKLEEQLKEINKSIADLYDKIHALHSLEALIKKEASKSKENTKSKK